MLGQRRRCVAPPKMGGELASDLPYHDDVSRQPSTFMFQCEHKLLTGIESKVDQRSDNESTLGELASAHERYAQPVWTACGRKEGRSLSAARHHLAIPTGIGCTPNSSMRCAHLTARRTARK
jgi:hypothetical protein